ncbi:STY4526/YPO1902 family pathogenicity island replication protein [Motilimonas pumila]|uniref:DUF2857 family protein n=1 Tax=Motilimonas pumila TaxID=2303987 RepID=A0A418YA36_9GAMM|nr:STY4526/YPO1902 family pathogenicity island replication protein [Motilimonas pumila]RJG38984.1 DUF2857 family protein [Motilimonas pumila]
MEDRDISALLASTLIESLMTSDNPDLIFKKLKKRGMGKYQLDCEEVSALLSSFNKNELYKIFQSVIYEKTAEAMPSEILNRLKSKAKGQKYICDSQAMCLAFLKRGAGNPLMLRLFGMGCKRAQRERRRLGVKPTTGRYKSLSEKEEKRVFSIYKSLNTQTDIKEKVIKIYDKTKININVIYLAVEYYQEQVKLIQMRKGERYERRNRIPRY